MTITRLLQWLLSRGRSPVLLGLIVVTLLMVFFASRLRVEQDTRSMAAEQPEQVAAYERFRDLFGNDEELLLSVTPPQLLSPAGLLLLNDYSERIAAIEGVRQVLSLSNARQLVAGSYGAEDIPLLPEAPYAEADVAELLPALERNPQYQGLFISADRRTAGLVIEAEDRRDDVTQRRQLIAAIRSFMDAEKERAELHLTGLGVQKIAVADYIQRDQRVVLPLVVVVLVVMLALFFRSLFGVLLPLLTTLVSLVWTMGLYALCGLELNTITSLLPPVVMVLAVSNSVHIYNGWLHLDGNSAPGIDPLVSKVAELFTPCLFTALTTSLGLLSLTISSVPAVRQFALFAALGVLLSLVVSLTLVPLGLSFLSLPGKHFRSGIGLLRQTLQNMAELTTKFPVAIVVSALLLLVVALFGLPQLQSNTNLVGFLRSDAPLVIDTNYIDRHLAGVNVLEYMLSAADGRTLNLREDFVKLERFSAAAKELQPVTNVYSILSLLQPLHRAESAAATAELAESQDQLQYELDLLQLAPDQRFQQRFVSRDMRTLRVSVWLHNIGSRSAATTVAELEEQGRRIFGPGYRLTATGSFYQMSEDSNRLVADLLKSFSLSILLVLLAILLLVRSLRMALLALIPNLIPILWAFGLMGYCGIDLSTGTTMIGAVVIGLAVDDTIHYLVHYRRVFAGDVAAAVTTTTTRIGRALLITTLVLACGFWIGCLGSFKPTIYFSFLVGGTLIGALLCDLLVLPAGLLLGAASRRGDAL